MATKTKPDTSSGAKPAAKPASDSGLAKRVANLERALLMALDSSKISTEEHVAAIRKLVTTGETPEDTASAREKAIAIHAAGGDPNGVSRVG